jgi:hypothetical protein
VFSRCDILDTERAVAKTWRPREWKERAREEPMPPAEQPVMRTVFCFGGAICGKSRGRGGIVGGWELRRAMAMKRVMGCLDQGGEKEIRMRYIIPSSMFGPSTSTTIEFLNCGSCTWLVSIRAVRLK